MDEDKLEKIKKLKGIIRIVDQFMKPTTNPTQSFVTIRPLLDKTRDLWELPEPEELDEETV